jgi:hypothetical protein
MHGILRYHKQSIISEKNVDINLLQQDPIQTEAATALFLVCAKDKYAILHVADSGAHANLRILDSSALHKVSHASFAFRKAISKLVLKRAGQLFHIPRLQDFI